MAGADKGHGYVRALMDPEVFPASLRGFMIAAFAAAYMSTIGTQLNWGASYVVNDFYRRFLVREAPEKHYVIVSQAVTVLLMTLSLIVTFYLESIEYAWKLMMVTGAGTGTVLLLRWFWWRINAWSEVSAMVVAAVVSLYLQRNLGWDSGEPRDFALIMLTTVGITTIAWVTVTLLTPPEPRETLANFYRIVKPEGPGWKPIAAQAGDIGSRGGESLATQFLNCFLGCVLIYATLFAIGKFIFKEWMAGGLWMVAAVVAAAWIYRNLSQADWSMGDSTETN
jgi:Na+/proline symporter